jgi:putative zinc finger protein
LIAELISTNERPSVGLKVSVSCFDMEFPRTAEQMEAALTDHAVDCRHCLAAALFRRESLAEIGCEEYQEMLAKMNTTLRVQETIEADEHVDEDVLEEYCFNRLSPEQNLRLEEHLIGCPSCADLVEDRLEFISCMKGALQLLEEEKELNGLTGAMAVRCPERNVSVYATVGR